MEEEVKARLEGLDKHFEANEKRFDDIKWYFGGVTGFFFLLFTFLGGFLGWNFISERASLREELREYKKEIRTELGKAEKPPEIKILGLDRLPLENQEILATFSKKEDGSVIMYLRHILANTGEGLTGPVYQKIYTSEPLTLAGRSADDPRFQFETTISPKDMDPSEFPGHYSLDWKHSIGLENKGIPSKGKYPASIRIFYGKGKVEKADFFIVVAQD